MNKLGRPRGTGGKPTKHATSEAHLAANREKAKRPRPGMRKDTPAEKLRAYKADGIGRRLCLEVMEQASRYLKANREMCDLLDAALSGPTPDPLGVARLAEARMSTTELCTMIREVHGRWGQPMRSVQDVAVRDMTPDYLAASRETAEWHMPPEDAHARPAGNGHAGNGSAH